MVGEATIPTPLSEAPSIHDLVSERLKAFRAVKNPIFWWLLLLLPWGIFLALLALGMVSLSRENVRVKC
ncbi:MAG TPA: hypothetical protein VFA32_24910, partial [Dehalococcoidia bacterium]|nr:hypothetical protein [Dehalococcoidia bacterium]